jgi:hypothetical protein
MFGVLLIGTASCTASSVARAPAQPTDTGQTVSPSATQTPSKALSPALADLLKVIHHKGYTTFAPQLRQAAESPPGLRAVLVAKPKYLGNGFRCANVFFFSHGHYVGRDSATCHLYPDINWGNGREISIVYPRYAKHDALCCPTPNPERVIFRLADAQMTRISGAPPRAPG